mmetsp:Transcript_91610/g.163050  ORF Transcript_91610/g.163050 Transcript_91610/m.163050 type:complete len:146 (+) Transcript_91610:553-990(+)
MVSKLKPEGNTAEVLSEIDGEVSDMSDKLAEVEGQSSLLQTQGQSAIALRLLKLIYGIVWIVVMVPVSFAVTLLHTFAIFASLIVCSLNMVVSGFFGVLLHSERLLEWAWLPTCTKALLVPTSLLTKAYERVAFVTSIPMQGATG